MRPLRTLVVLLLASCAPTSVPFQAPTPTATTPGALDDGTFLERIDPLGGQWRVKTIGGENFERFKASVNFSEGGFLNHGAGCSGGYPAFYRLEGQRLTIIRREPVRIGKCASAAAAESERRLTSFLDQAVAWDKPDAQTLILSARDGTSAVLARPVEPHPDLAGRWMIETIGGVPLVTQHRPPTLSISMETIGVGADCNSISALFTIPSPGRISVGRPISTEKGCLPKESAEDALMTKAMTSATAYRIANGKLVFTGGPGMVLRRPALPNRRLVGEYAWCGNTLLGAFHKGPITLAIDPHTMRDNAGCTAEYSAKGANLILRLANDPACAQLAPPLVPGEAILVGGKISTLAVTRPDGFGFDDQGRLILRTTRGLLSMCRKGSAPPFGG